MSTNRSNSDDPAPPRTGGLIEQARRGDPNAYDELFARASDPTLLYIRARLGPALRARVEPADILQETYTAAHRSFERFVYDGEGSMVRWLCRIAENQIRDQADHFGARKRRPPGRALPATEILDRVGHPGTGPSTAFGRIETRERILDSLDALEEEERQAILLRYFRSLTIDEIAADLDRSPTAVRRLLGRAIRRMGRQLRSQG
jgi:RNA polymerase sigma-70 factor (ECF subfamily)